MVISKTLQSDTEPPKKGLFPSALQAASSAFDLAKNTVQATAHTIRDVALGAEHLTRDALTDLARAAGVRVVPTPTPAHREKPDPVQALVDSGPSAAVRAVGTGVRQAIAGGLHTVGQRVLIGPHPREVDFDHILGLLPETHQDLIRKFISPEIYAGLSPELLNLMRSAKTRNEAIAVSIIATLALYIPLDANKNGYATPELVKMLDLVTESFVDLAMESLPPSHLRTLGVLNPSALAAWHMMQAKNTARKEMIKMAERAGKIAEPLTEIFEKITDKEDLVDSDDVLKNLAKRLSFMLVMPDMSIEKAIDIIFADHSPIHEHEFNIKSNTGKKNITRKDFEKAISDDDDHSAVAAFRESLQERQGPSLAFEYFYNHRSQHKTMDAFSIWAPYNDAEGRPYQHIAELAQRSNDVAREIFGMEFSMNKTVESTNDLKTLRELVRTLPLNAEDLNISQSAIAKLVVMRHLLSADTESKPKEQAAVTEFLGDLLAKMVHTYDGVNVLNPPRDNNGRPLETLKYSKLHIPIDRVEVGPPKTLASSVSKSIRKDLPSVSDIKDGARFTIFAKPEDSFDADGNIDPLKLDAWMTSVLAILMSLFGSDIDVSRSRYSVESGGTRPTSTGNHFGTHFTFTVKHNHPVNGLAADASNRNGQMQVEVQLKAFASQEEDQADHDLYKLNEPPILRSKAGCEQNFKEFVLDLMKVIRYPNFDFGARDNGRISQLDDCVQKFLDARDNIDISSHALEQIDIPALLASGIIPNDARNEKIALMFLEIMTAQDASGAFVNQSLINEILKNHEDEFIEVTSACADYRDAKSPFKSLIWYKNAQMMAMHHNGDPEHIVQEIELTPTISSDNGQTKINFSAAKVAELKAPIHYQGPLSQISEDISGRTIFTTTFAAANDNQNIQKHVIEKVGNTIVCYMLDREGVEIPIWEGHHDTTKDQIVIYQYDYSIHLDEDKTSKFYGKTSLRTSGLKSEPVATYPSSQLENLKPQDGMDPMNKYPYLFMEQLNRQAA